MATDWPAPSLQMPIDSPTRARWSDSSSAASLDRRRQLRRVDRIPRRFLVLRGPTPAAWGNLVWWASTVALLRQLSNITVFDQFWRTVRSVFYFFTVHRASVGDSRNSYGHVTTCSSADRVSNNYLLLIQPPKFGGIITHVQQLAISTLEPCVRFDRRLAGTHADSKFG